MASNPVTRLVASTRPRCSLSVQLPGRGSRSLLAGGIPRYSVSAIAQGSSALLKPGSPLYMTRRTMATHRLTLDNIRPCVRDAQYAVRGELATKAEEYQERLQKGDRSLPFDKVIFANIGNPQQLDQKPITFFRQVLSLLEYPALLENEELLKSSFGFKPDVIDRAKKLLDGVHSVGAYSHSQGARIVRESVAKFIEQRDGFAAEPKDIFLSAGASSGVNTLLHVICANKSSGVLVPIPQYPLYTATLAVLEAHCVPYYLEEDKAWGTDVHAIRQSVAEAKANGIDVRAIVVINPGNPTGASLSADDIKGVLDLAVEENLVVIADEVYQTNVFVGEFTSFRKRLHQLQQEVPGKYDRVELTSLHSVSKGMVGECGHRGGYFELINFNPEVQAQIYKLVSIMLCPPVIGQCLVELMVNPPQKGEPSFDLYQQEYYSIQEGLKQRAWALYEGFKRMEGVECQEPQGAMYLFPTITLPPKAIEAARAAKKEPDEFYTLALLDATGVCLVPGSGFGQKEGTLHFRTTFLAPGTEWICRITQFHEEFMTKYR